jgi:hypothetical protein
VEPGINPAANSFVYAWLLAMLLPIRKGSMPRVSPDSRAQVRSARELLVRLVYIDD